MKHFILIALITLYGVKAYTYEISTNSYGIEISWPEGEINITLDPSLEQLENGYMIIEESYLEWLDYIDRDISINFVYKDCVSGENCVRYINDYFADNKSLLGVTWWNSNKEGDIFGSNINLYILSNGPALKNVILHEIGHFFGLSHSNNPDAIMWPLLNTSSSLHEDDIAGIKTLYDLNNNVYPAPEISSTETETSEEESPKKHNGIYAPCCSFNSGNQNKSIFSLLFN